MSHDLPENAIDTTTFGDAKYYVYQSYATNELTENAYRNQWSVPIPVGTARRGTPAAYILYNDSYTERVCLSTYSEALLTPGEVHNSLPNRRQSTPKL